MTLLPILWLAILTAGALAFRSPVPPPPSLLRGFLQGLGLQAAIGQLVAWIPFWARAHPLSLESLRHGFVFAGGRAAFGIIELTGTPDSEGFWVWALPVGVWIAALALFHGLLVRGLPDHSRRIRFGYVCALVLNALWGLHFLRNIPVG